MDLIVKKSDEISGTVAPPPSKFYTQFTTAISLLADGKSVIESPLIVDDTRDLIKSMESMGGTTKRSKEKWSIWGNGYSIAPEGQEVDAKKSIINLSLLASLSGLTDRIMVIMGKKQVRSCPVPSFLDSLQKLGVNIHSTKNDESPPLVTFESKIKGGEISLGEDYDPRFLPAFLLLTPYAEEGVELKLTPNLKGRYLESSLELLKKSKIDVSVDQEILKISPSEYKPVKVTPPLDIFSTMPHVVAAILTDSKLRISKISHAKNVSEFVSLLEEIGIETEQTSRSLKILTSQELKTSEINLQKYPELFPFIAVLACKIEDETKIKNAARARRSKSDRIKAIVEGLSRLGVEIKENEDGVTINGPCDLKSAKVNGYDDSELVAAFGIAGLTAEGKTVVKNRAEALRQTYPEFVTVFKDLGANIGYST